MQNDHRNQKNYRTLLQAMSRPGRMLRLEQEDPVSPLFPCLAIAECLLDQEVSVCVTGDGTGNDRQSAVIRATGARPASLLEADFVFVFGAPGECSILQAKRGSLEFPEEGATIVYCMNEQRPDALDRFQVRLIGPGIAGDIGIVPEMRGLALEDLRELQAADADYPMGVDAIFSRKDGALMCIPRSCRICLR
jgi:alpha-D-ribose 1-methylphosphonate 5-triphosphate synthase subunit PhnH